MRGPAGAARVTAAQDGLLDVGGTLKLGSDQARLTIAGGTVDGAFASVDLPEAVDWDTSSLGTTGELRLRVIPEPARLALLALGGLALLRRRKG